MKRKIFWTFCALTVSVLGFWFWSQRPGLVMEGVLPAHPLVFARLVHVEEHVNQVIQSDFGKSIAAIDLPDVLNRNNFLQKNISDIQHWQKDLVEFWETL